jgi:hypothetical protein
MGFYIRKAFNFGPLRLNLSRSGLGASFGVRGARIGIGPRGSYVHMGRGGLYYRQTLHSDLGSSHPEPDPASLTFPSADLQEITSSAATGMADSSAGQLLHELDRVRRRKDLFPFTGVVGAALIIRVFILGVSWWLLVLVGLAAIILAVWSRHYDVTTGTALLNYSFEGDSDQSFSKLRGAFEEVAGCKGVWHVDASGSTSDWKRNAGVNSLERRSYNRPFFSRPPKVQCNIDVPTLTAGRKSLYFFPDRLLVYDSGGVGAVSYGELHAQVTQTRFAEQESVPTDAQRVGTTWRYVNKSGGPDRRFNNNRQLPVLLYGQFSLRSGSGLNELFQCSVPSSALQFTSAIAEFGAGSKPDNHVSNSSAGVMTAPRAENTHRATGAILWTALGIMTVFVLFLPWPSLNLSAVNDLQAQREQQRVEENEARQLFAQGLAQRLLSKNPNVTASAANNTLNLQFTKEGPKAMRRDGLQPFDKKLLFNRFLQPSTESELCGLGFRYLTLVKNGLPANVHELACAPTP